MAYELKEELRKEDRVTVVSDKDRYQFVPSNPWLAVNWRKPPDIEVPLAPCFEEKGIDFIPVGAKRVDPEKNRIELDDDRTGHAIKAAEAWDAFVKDPGPIVVGVVQGVSCFGPAGEPSTP
jgi:sulfide:quinone oxidoreductase